jgi:hypothetical protein
MMKPAKNYTKEVHEIKKIDNLAKETKGSKL